MCFFLLNVCKDIPQFLQAAFQIYRSVLPIRGILLKASLHPNCFSKEMFAASRPLPCVLMSVPSMSNNSRAIVFIDFQRACVLDVMYDI